MPWDVIAAFTAGALVAATVALNFAAWLQRRAATLLQVTR